MTTIKRDGAYCVTASRGVYRLSGECDLGSADRVYASRSEALQDLYACASSLAFRSLASPAVPAMQLKGLPLRRRSREMLALLCEHPEGLTKLDFMKAGIKTHINVTMQELIALHIVRAEREGSRRVFYLSS